MKTKMKILSIVISGFAVIATSAGSALAWTYGLSGVGACQADNSFKITWTLSNAGESKPLVITSSDRSVIPVNTSVPAGGSASYMETVSGATAADYTLNLSGNWPAVGGDNNIVNKQFTVHSIVCGGRGGGGEDEDKDKVTLCHATDSKTNPYVRITVDASGAYHGHYSEHQGSVFNGSDTKWGDIIPTFSYRDHSYSLNWDAAGQAIYNNNCQPVGGMGGGEVTPPAPTPTPTVTPTTTPTGGLGGGVVAAAAVTPQVVTPAGGVGAGEGGAPQVLSIGGLFGLAASVGSLGFGLRRLKTEL